MLEGMRAEPPGNEAAKMFAAQVDFDRPRGTERISQIADAAQMIANGATALIDAFDDRLRFADGEAFEAVRTIRFAGDAIPGT